VGRRSALPSAGMCVPSPSPRARAPLRKPNASYTSPLFPSAAAAANDRAERPKATDSHEAAAAAAEEVKEGESPPLPPAWLHGPPEGGGAARADSTRAYVAGPGERTVSNEGRACAQDAAGRDEDGEDAKRSAAVAATAANEKEMTGSVGEGERVFFLTCFQRCHRRHKPNIKIHIPYLIHSTYTL